MRKEDKDPLTHQIIGAAIEVHRGLGPGLLESAYEECLCWELDQLKLKYGRQLPLPVVYKGVTLPLGYRMDIVVESKIILELKTVEQLLPVHEAQMLSYLRLSGIHVGLLINFHGETIRDNLKRMVL